MKPSTKRQPQKRVTIKAYGPVQRTGYRYAVQDVARRLDVKDHVKNLPDGTVEVIAEAPKNTLEKFIQAVKIKEPPIKVEDLKIRFSEATGEYEFFNIVYGELTEEMAEGFGTGLKYINLSRKENKQGFQTLGNEVREMHKDMNTSFREMSEKYDVISQNLGDAVKIIQQQSTKTREELIRVVDNLSKLVEEFIKVRRFSGKSS